MPRPQSTRSRATAGVVALALAAVAPAAQDSSPAPDPFPLLESSVADLQRRMAEGRDTSRSLVAAYLARIDSLDKRGPALRSVLQTNPDALEIADRLDAERKAGRVRGPLHGIPVLLKDNIATGDRMLTTAGSLALTAPAPRDAFVVARLRDAGAVILGKTNLSEWANIRSTHSSSGWSARGGQTRNPYALDHSPSGSSSGSGVAVAASMAAVAVGTETDGSIVSPASVNGLVGIKPTVGLVSRTGIIPIAHSQDTAGPMARTVADAATLLTVLAGPDPADPATSGRRAPVDYTRGLDRRGLRGARIGVVRNRLFGSFPAADALASAAIVAIRAEGATVVDPVQIESLRSLDEDETEVLLHELKSGLPAFFEWWGPAAPVRTLEDIIAFNTAHADQELAYFGQELFELARTKGPLTSPAYLEALARGRRRAGPEGIDAAMKRHRLDALIAPTGGPAWPIDLVNGDGAAFPPTPSTVAAVAGYPHITVPMGSDRGLPLGLSFFGGAWSEATLIRIAYAYEQATLHRRPPKFAVTAPPP